MSETKRGIAYEIHTRVQKNFLRRRVVVENFCQQWQSDLVSMLPYRTINRNYSYIMTVIDCFSKFGWAVPLKRKTGLEVANALRSILESREKSFLKPPDIFRMIWVANFIRKKRWTYSSLSI